MRSPQSSSRRLILSASVLLPLTVSAPTALAAPATTPRNGSRTLVAYFSRTGNTRVIAGQIHRARGTDLFEIQPATSYPEDYEQTVAQAQVG